MKFTVTKPVEIDISHVLIIAPIRHGEEDVPADFPLRRGETWRAMVEIESGRIIDWPLGRSGKFAQKQVDTGTYALLGPDGTEHASIEQDYVPNSVVPGKYGDYIDLQINEAGVITNWPKHPDVSAFFPGNDD